MFFGFVTSSELQEMVLRYKCGRPIASRQAFEIDLAHDADVDAFQPSS